VLTEKGARRRAVVILISVGLAAAGLTLARNSAGEARGEASAGSAALPAALIGSPDASPDASVTAAAPTTAASTPPVGAAVVRDEPGVPTSIDIAASSRNHPDGVHAPVVSHRLNSDGTLYIPADPRVVSWTSDDAAPGSSRGTVILTGHIDYVIDGKTVAGAFADLAQYAHQAIGRRVTLHLSDGRVLRYRIVAGREYTKGQLARDPRLRTTLYDQASVYGPADRPSSRLLLVSCGGPFDPDTGEYQDNVFLYALPVN
jgi:hypothetical protein